MRTPFIYKEEIRRHRQILDRAILQYTAEHPELLMGEICQRFGMARTQMSEISRGTRKPGRRPNTAKNCAIAQWVGEHPELPYRAIASHWGVSLGRISQICSAQGLRRKRGKKKAQ